MGFQLHAGLDELDAFALKELALQGCVGFADEQLPAIADHAVPRDAFS